MVAKAVNGQDLPDHEPFDVIMAHHALEVKALLTNSNDKITMNNSAIIRKMNYVGKTGKMAHTVVVDMRQHSENPDVYHRAGVGSFRIANMDKVPGGMNGLLAHIKGVVK
jgi:hypothetical protein